MNMLVALVWGALLSSAAIAQHEHGSTVGNETATETVSERSNGNGAGRTEQGEGAERMICRRIDRTSSRVGRDRICMTAAQWREHDRND